MIRQFNKILIKEEIENTDYLVIARIIMTEGQNLEWYIW